MTKIIPVFGVIAVLLKVCSICSESIDRPMQTEIVLKSVSVYYIYLYIIFSKVQLSTKIV